MLIPNLLPGRLLLGSLCAVLGTALLTVGYALCVQRTADDVVTDTRQVTYTAAADQDNRVFLKIAFVPELSLWIPSMM